MILVTDVDFQKDKDKKPIGLPILGPVPYKLLEQAGFSQPTASLYQGKRTYQFFWPWEDRFKILSNSRLTGTTIDIRTARGQVVLYRPLPPLDIWNNLNSMPDDLFEIIKTLSKESSADDWEDGNRNNTLFKKIALDIERNQGGKVPEIIAKAKAVGLPDREVNQTAKSAVKTAVQGDHGIDPGPSLNEATAPVASQKQVKKEHYNLGDLSRNITPSTLAVTGLYSPQCHFCMGWTHRKRPNNHTFKPTYIKCYRCKTARDRPKGGQKTLLISRARKPFEHNPKKSQRRRGELKKLHTIPSAYIQRPKNASHANPQRFSLARIDKGYTKTNLLSGGL